MNHSDGFDRTVSDWLRADAEHRVPDHLDAVLRWTRTERQRPAWSSLERWLPVQTTLRFAPVPRAAWLLVVLALVVGLWAAIVIVGSSPRRADPFGLAQNGSLVYGGTDGDLYILDPITGVSTALVTGPEIDLAPYFSRDGSRFVFGRKASVEGQYLLMLANADGTGVRVLSEPLVGLESATWSPDSSRLAVVAGPEGAKTLSILALDGTAVPTIASGLEPENVQWRPDGREVVFRGATDGPGRPTYGLYAIRADGTRLRPIQPPTDSDEHWQNPALSPDGTRIIYTQWGDPDGHLWVVGVDGGPVQRLHFDGSFASDYFATWSADGSQIVFNRGRAQETYHLAVGPAGGGHAVDIGPVLPWDAAASAEFSPDGSKVIARYSNGSTWILPVNGAPGEPLELSTNMFVASWQRLPR